MKGITRTDIGLLLLRLGLGLTLLYFGSQKALGVFGGMGYSNTVGMMHGKMGIPIVLANLAILAEFLGSLGVLTGLFSALASFGIACTMGVATYINMRGNGALLGLFTGAKGADPSKLFFPGSLCLVALVLLIMGPGKISLDNKFFLRKSKR